MPSNIEIEDKFWKALKSDMTVMLGLTGVEEGHAQPMTAQFDGEAGRGPIYFFTAKDTDLVEALGAGQAAALHFADKGHDLFASVEGRLAPVSDRALVDRLWNKWVAAWYQGGKEDPNLQLIRFEPDHAQIWLNENNLFAGVKMLLGHDPKKDYEDKVADVRLN